MSNVETVTSLEGDTFQVEITEYKGFKIGRDLELARAFYIVDVPKGIDRSPEMQFGWPSLDLAKCAIDRMVQ